MPFVVSLSNHERPFDKLRANGMGAGSGVVMAFKVRWSVSRADGLLS